MKLTLQEMLSKTICTWDTRRSREPTFSLMINHLKTIKDPLIIETGCSRYDKNSEGFDGDGFSTIIFDTFINQYGGEFRTVDINPENIVFAKAQVSEKTQFFCEDSVGYLWKLNKELTEQNRYIDLLYLDSFDFEPSNPHPSSLHHVKELTAIFSRLKSGSMITLDDNFGDCNNRTGKGKYVEEFMKDIGIPLQYDGYQLVWII